MPEPLSAEALEWVRARSGREPRAAPTREQRWRMRQHRRAPLPTVVSRPPTRPGPPSDNASAHGNSHDLGRQEGALADSSRSAAEHGESVLIAVRDVHPRPLPPPPPSPRSAQPRGAGGAGSGSGLGSGQREARDAAAKRVGSAHGEVTEGIGSYARRAAARAAATKGSEAGLGSAREAALGASDAQEEQGEEEDEDEEEEEEEEGIGSFARRAAAKGLRTSDLRPRDVTDSHPLVRP